MLTSMREPDRRVSETAEIIGIDLSAAIDAAERGPLGRAPGIERIARFGVIGCFGFVWDTSTVYLARAVIGLVPAILLGFFVAVTLNWVANRLWTFRDCADRSPLLRQWALYVAANALGFVLNRGTAMLLVLSVPLCHAVPVIALAAGAIAGLGANFTLSQLIVFRPRPA